jgi:hypothetical protein
VKHGDMALPDNLEKMEYEKMKDQRRDSKLTSVLMSEY